MTTTIMATEIPDQVQQYLMQLAQQLIQINSVTPDQSSCQPVIQEYLQDLNFNCLTLNKNDTNNLLALNADTAPTLLFSGHSDVVPVLADDLTAWKFPPFAGTIDQDILYGRGSVDMKGAIAAFIAALFWFKQLHGSIPAGLAVAISGDEEGTGVHGSRVICDFLKQKNLIPEYVLIGEPTANSKVGDQIKMGMRTSLNAKIIFKGKSGHAAYPKACQNPSASACTLLYEICQLEFDACHPDFEKTQAQVTYLNAGEPIFNVTPNQVCAYINFRINPAQTIEDIKSQVKKLCQDTSIELEWHLGRDGYMQTNSDFSQLVAQCIETQTTQKPIISTVGGASDGCFFKALGSDIAECGLVHRLAHQKNECVSIPDLSTLTKIYLHILLSLPNGIN